MANKQKLARYALTMLALLLSTSIAMAQQHLKLQFNFEHVSGQSVTDPISGVTAQLMNQAKVVDYGKYHVLDLGNGTGYLDMTKEAGTMAKNLNDFTVSVYYRVNKDASLSGAGYFLWCFSQSEANTQTASPYMGYRLNAQRMATSTGGWGSEVGTQVGNASTKGQWIHMLYRQTGQQGELFINGKKAAQASGMPIPSKAFTDVPAFNWIGRPPFATDIYLKQTLVSDFRLYDVALSDEDVAQLASVASQMEYDYKYGTRGDFTPLRTAIEEGQSFLASATNGYAPGALAELQDAISLAQMELKANRASQALINEYVTNLQSTLAKTKATLGYQAKKMFAHTSDHGFKHPGGIVSQEDIDRAKQLLADGDTRLQQAWEKLCANAYSHADVQTWPTETVVRGGGSGQNYMNCARGAAMAYQNALRWKIGGTKENADAAVRILMSWANACKGVGGDTNMSLAAGIYGHEFANAAELMRDYEGWSAEDFTKFKQWIIKVFYNPSIDFLRRRHDTWLNARYSSLGERPGHYWSNWGLCNALCVMSIGILCDDVHMYNQGVSFYKYDLVGTYKDRSKESAILNDGCNEFIGNLVPVVLPDERGPLGYLGQMQESGRDQGHALMALGLAVDICQVGLTQGDDLFAYMNDRIAAGAEHVAALNFGDVDASSLPWITYNYADCRGTMGAGWAQGAPNTGGKGEHRPYWDRLIGYYEGLRGVTLQYSEKASAQICPDGGGGNYSQNSGGFDALGFSTLTSWRPSVTTEQAITPLHGDIIYKGETLKNQTNLGGIGYKYQVCPSKGIPADGSDIVLVPQLPEGAEDSGNWQWSTGETTRQITVKADHSYIYRVAYTAANGKVSQQAFAIAVSGDADADPLTPTITVDGITENVSEKTVLAGSTVVLYTAPATGWTDDYLWDNGKKESSVEIPSLMSSRTYTCQYANQSGAVSESHFVLTVVPARQLINGSEATEAQVLSGASVTLALDIPAAANPNDVTWSDGLVGCSRTLDDVTSDVSLTATYGGIDYTFTVQVKIKGDYTYYSMLTSDKGYSLVTSTTELEQLANDHFFVLASDVADLLIGLKDAPNNGNKALFFESPTNPVGDLSKVFTIELTDGFCHLRNIDYDGLTLQTEWNRPDQLRTHDQPYACEWSRLSLAFDNGAWTVENGKYPGNWLGLWTPTHGFVDGEEIACNKTGGDIAHLQIFAIDRSRFYADYIAQATEDKPFNVTPLMVNPDFVGNGYGWDMSGKWGNQRYNGAVEVWHSTNFNFSQTLSGLPDGSYTVSCQLVNGEGNNTGYLYATSANASEKAVVEQSCSGSNFDAERNKMADNKEYAALSVTVNVVGGKLTYGIAEPSEGSTWLVWDHFQLIYNGPVAAGIQGVTELPVVQTDAYYDLLGRKVSHPKHGIYIHKGKKILVK